MGKAKRFNPYDEAVAEKRKLVKSYGEARQKLSIGSSFGNPPLEPPIATSTAAGAGTGDGKFLTVSLAVDQTANIAVNNHIEFDTKDEDGDIVLQTGAGQADGLFELESGKKYYLQVSLRPEFSGSTGQLEVAWFDQTNTAEIGSRAKYEAQDHSGSDANQPTASAIVTPATNIIAKVEILSVTALDGFANEYCHANLFEIALGGAGAGGGGGSSGVTFPITPTINDHGNVGTVTEDIDISLSTGHVHKITMTGNPTLTFSNPPISGVQMEFEIEFVQDATGGRTVTHPAAVKETITLASAANTTTIITYRTNDNGTTYHAIPALRGTISLSGNFLELTGGTMSGNIAMGTNDVSGGGTFTSTNSTITNLTATNQAAVTMTGDITMGNKDILTAKDLQFQNGGTLTNTVSMIMSDTSGDMSFNVASGDQYNLYVAGGTARMELDVNDMQLVSLTSDTNDLNFLHGDTTPANNDIPGKLQWAGFDDVGGGPFVYASIWGVQEDVSAGTLDASIRFSCASAGSEIDLMTMNFASNTTRVFQNLVPSGAGKSLGLSSLSWADNYMDIINAGGSTDLDLKCDSGQNINMFSNSVSRGFFDDTGFSVTTGLHFVAQASDPTSSQEMQSNLNNIVMLTEEFKLKETGSSIPDFTIIREDTTPNDDDIVGRINFQGLNDNVSQVTDDYVQLLGVQKDVSSAGEDGSFQVKTLKAGTLSLSFEVRHSTAGVFGFGFDGNISSLFTYVPSNVTTVRSFDANQAFDATQWAVLNDVVGTLIIDMQAHGMLL